MSKNSSRIILVIGTFDTKNDELFYLSDCIQKQNSDVLTMDVCIRRSRKRMRYFQA